MKRKQLTLSDTAKASGIWKINLPDGLMSPFPTQVEMKQKWLVN